MSDYILLVLGILFMIIGIIGCLVPVLPGPILSFIGLILLHLTRFGQFTTSTLIIKNPNGITTGDCHFFGMKYATLKGAASVDILSLKPLRFVASCLCYHHYCPFTTL